jgi:valyl-tRNA synthetase
MQQEGFRKTYLHWIDNLHDWCISRQIWFGHRVPVWYKSNETYCGVTAPEGDGWEQDPDVLDTWFSSALWTFSTLGWPENTKDMQTFHPTDFMSPAYEILPLWVSRMILMSGFHLGEVPFKKVLIHGLVRAKDGRKFSKSLNNGIDPLDMVDKYGADALRMGLMIGSAIGNDVKFDEQKVRGYKLFANKIWNVTRFVLENTKDFDPNAKLRDYLSEESLHTQHTAYHKQLTESLSDITLDLDNYRLYLAGEKIYHYFWHTFADEIIEWSKPLLKSTDENEVWVTQHLLLTILADTIKVLHPFMPFVTEEIWGSLPKHLREQELLMVEAWPL